MEHSRSFTVIRVASQTYKSVEFVVEIFVGVKVEKYMSMKKYIILCLTTLMSIVGARADYVSVADVTLSPGQTADVAINLTNTTTNYVSFQMDLTLPSGITINKAGCSLSSRFADANQELVIGKQDGNTYRLTSTSFSLVPISGNSGKIITLSLKASSSSQGGTATINNIIFGTSNSQTVTLSNTSFNISVETSLSIKATGNGSAAFNGTTVRNTTKTFAVNKGTSPTITFSPDAGYKIKSVKKDGTTVTSSVTNNQYTVSNIQSSTTVEVEFEAITHTLSIKASGNGYAYFNSTSIRNKTENFTVNEGSSATIAFTPDAGYKIKSVKKNGTNVTTSVTNNQYTVSNIAANVTVEVEFEAITHTLSITATGYGSASYNSTTVRNATKTFTVNEGSSATIAFTPDAGYKIKSVKKNGTNVTTSVTNNQYTASNIAADVTVEVEFEPITHTLSITATGYGSASYNSTTVRNATKTFTVNEGSSATIAFTPDAGYKIKSVKKNGTNVTTSVNNNQYTVSNIAADVTVEVEFEAITHTLSITASGYGSVSYNSTTVRNATKTFTVNEGSSATIAFMPDAGYKIKSVKKNGTNVTTSVTNNQYTVSNIAADVTVEVEFEAIPPSTFILSITASGYGSASYNSTTVRNATKTFTVNEGSSATITFTPDAGYKIKSVKKNGTNVTTSVTNNQYTVSNIAADVSVEVEFEAITHTLSITATGYGSASYNSTSIRNTTKTFTVNEGTSATITFTPDAGYKIKSVKKNGTNVTSSVTNNQYTVSNIAADVTVEVEFEAITHTLSITATGYGSASYNSTSIRNTTKTFTVNEGSSATITFSPDDGYKIKSVKLNSTNVTSSVANNQYTVSNIAADVTVEVEFEAITHTLSITATGYGSASYNSTSIRNTTKTFTVNEGTSATIAFTPDAGYKIKSVKKNGTNVTSSVANNQYTVSIIAADVNVEVEFEAITHTLSITATGYGSASYNSTTVRNTTMTFVANEGSSATIAFTPDAGYKIKSVKKNGTNVTASVTNNQYTVSNIAADVSVEVEFEAITHTLSIASTGSGYAYFNNMSVRNTTNTFTVNEGSSATISFIPDDGYLIKNVKKDGVDVTSSVSNGQYMVSNIAADVTIEVEFEAITRTLSITATGYGSASYGSAIIRDATKTFTVNEGSSVTITFSPDDGYKIKSVKLNSTNVTSSVANGRYTVSNITADTSVEVEFEPITHTLLIQASGNGVALFDDTTIRNQTVKFAVNEGSSATVMFTPDNGYRIKSILLNSINVTSSVTDNQYTIGDIMADEILEVEFEAITHTFFVKASGNGVAVYEGTTIRNKMVMFTVNEGSFATIQFTPDKGNRIKSVKLNSNDVTSDVMSNQYTVTNIQDDLTVEVEFEAIPPTMCMLTIAAQGGGTVACEGKSARDGSIAVSIEKGTSTIVYFTPDVGYRIKSVKKDVEDVTSSVSDNQYSVSNIQDDTRIEVEFEAITHTLSITATGYGTASYNKTSVRNTTKSFTVNESSSATISLSPDDGYKVKDVKLNSINVTSSVTNGEFIVNNITADVTLEVEFEAIPHTLSIKATGGGYASFNNTSVRNSTKTFTVNEGTSATISFTPDNGCRIKSVMKDGVDVTSSLNNSQYTISNIQGDTMMEVIFETITHTLSIKASGNGAAVYNGTGVRNQTITFAVNEGATPMVMFIPDSGYRIKSVKLNTVDVTSTIYSSQYSISNIMADAYLEVEFEAIPPTICMLTIAAQGNGEAVCEGRSIRSGSISLSMEKGTSTTVYFMPDKGCRIKSVKKDGVDVTSIVSDDQYVLYEEDVVAPAGGVIFGDMLYMEGDIIHAKGDMMYTISNLQTDTSIEVEFEVITHTLFIRATGNGAATYDGTTIRNATNTFVVNEGMTATISFLADEGHKMLSVKRDGADVTTAIADNQLTVDDIRSDILVEVEFVARPTSCTYETVNYVVQSFADMTVLVAPGDYGKVLEVPAIIPFDGDSWRVGGLEKDALANSTSLAAVIWHPATAFAATVGNPNLLLYVDKAEYAPAAIGNVVVKGVSDNIVLADAASGNDFFCPQEFTAKRISYSHRYSMETGMDEARGWETIALPFDVQRIVHQSKGEIVPFALRSNGDSRRPFWLMAFTDKGWTAADGIKANTPYIISMPNHPDYYDDFLLNGVVTFESENVAVKASDTMKPSQQGDKTFVPNFGEMGMGEGVFALNVSNDLEQNTSGMAEGSHFVLNMRRVHPFEAYMKSSSTRSPWIDIDEDMDDTNRQADDRVGVFTLGGQLLKRGADEADALRSLRSGVYIVNRKKVIVK